MNFRASHSEALQSSSAGNCVKDCGRRCLRKNFFVKVESIHVFDKGTLCKGLEFLYTIIPELIDLPCIINANIRFNVSLSPA